VGFCPEPDTWDDVYGCAIGAGKKQSNSPMYFASAQKTLPRERMKVRTSFNVIRAIAAI
jgi:hypothetical protein